MSEPMTLSSYLHATREAFDELLTHVQAQCPDQEPLVILARGRLEQLCTLLPEDLTYLSAFQIWDLRGQLTLAQQQIAQFAEDLNKQQSTLITLEDRRVGDLDRLAGLQEDLNIARDELRKSIEREQKLHAQSDPDLIQQLTQQLAEREAQLLIPPSASALEIELAAQVETLTQALSARSAELTALQDLMTEQNNNLSLLQDQWTAHTSDTTAQVALLQQQLIEKDQHIVALSDQLHQQAVDFARTTDQVAALTNQLNERDALVAQVLRELEERSNTLTTVQEQAAHSLQDGERQIHHLSTELAQREDQIQQLTLQMGKLTQEVEQWSDQLEVLAHQPSPQQIREEYDAQLVLLGRQLQLRDQQLDELNQQLEVWNSRLESLNVDAQAPDQDEAMRLQLELAFDKLLEAQTQGAEAQQQLGEVQTERDLIIEEYAAQLEVQQGLEENLRLVSAQYQESQSTLAQAQEHIAHLEARLAQLESTMVSGADNRSVAQQLADKMELLQTPLPLAVSSLAPEWEPLLAQMKDQLLLQQQAFNTQLARLEQQQQIQYQRLDGELALIKHQLFSEAQVKQATIRSLLEEAGLDPDSLE